MASTEAVQVPFFKKKRARPTTTRQRTASPPAADAGPSSSSKSQVVLPSRKAAGNLLSAGTKRTSSQRRTDDLDEDEADENTRDGPGINWTSTGGHVNKALEILEGDEADEMLAKRARKDDVEGGDVPDDGLYHGQKSYKSHIKKSQEVPKSMRTGPVRSNNSTIRTVTIVDYQPDVCKDYKGVFSPLLFFFSWRTCSDRLLPHQKPVSAALEIRVNSCTTEEHVRSYAFCHAYKLIPNHDDNRPRRMATR
jgi:RING finger protein 113A